MRKLNIHSLRKSLNNLCNQLSISYTINEGGCCFVAYLIASHLDKLGVRYKLIIFSDKRKNLEKIQAEVRSKIVNRTAEFSVTGTGTCNHYSIYLEGGGSVNIDDFNGGYMKYYIEGVDSNHIKWIYRTGRWNPSYDRRNNRIIRKTFNTFFNGYEKEDCLSNH